MSVVRHWIIDDAIKNIKTKTKVDTNIFIKKRERRVELFMWYLHLWCMCIVISSLIIILRVRISLNLYILFVYSRAKIIMSIGRYHHRRRNWPVWLYLCGCLSNYLYVYKCSISSIYRLCWATDFAQFIWFGWAMHGCHPALPPYMPVLFIYYFSGILFALNDCRVLHTHMILICNSAISVRI